MDFLNLFKIKVIIFLLFISTTSIAQTDFILVFTKTEGFRHQSIPNGIEAIKKLGETNDFEIVDTEDATYFQKDSLQQFDAVMFLNTTGNVLDDNQQKSLQYFIKQGGGFIGIHSASDTEYDWSWYGKLIGGYFKSHPKQQTATLNIIDTLHIATRKLPVAFEYFDEWYNLKNISQDINVLITIDESTYTGGENGNFHPISWYQEYDGCRMFYTSLGHRREDYTNQYFLEHLLGGINYVLENDE